MMNPAYLAATPTLDFQHPRLRQFVENYTTPAMSQREAAVALYYAVRDSFRYDPYKLDLSVDGMKASATLEKGYGWCVSKAVLLAACCRFLGIPARLGFGDVRNHLSTRRLRESMNTDVFFWHGYTEIFLEGCWVKATPAFNIELCEKFGLTPLEFSGKEDSIFHAFDRAGNRHMEYLHDRGRYDDLPLAEIRATFARYYSKLLEQSTADFAKDVAGEVSG